MSISTGTVPKEDYVDKVSQIEEGLVALKNSIQSSCSQKGDKGALSSYPAPSVVMPFQQLRWICVVYNKLTVSLAEG